MRDESFFLRPVHEWQRRYEALRASFVERLPARICRGWTEPSWISGSNDTGKIKIL
jgi:hypothetical protein